MTKLRIVKEYRPWSPKAGIQEADIVDIPGGSEECAQFVSRVNAGSKSEFDIIDWELVLTTKMERPEILKNPTGGGTGKLLLPGKDFKA